MHVYTLTVRSKPVGRHFVPGWAIPSVSFPSLSSKSCLHLAHLPKNSLKFQETCVLSADTVHQQYHVVFSFLWWISYIKIAWEIPSDVIKTPARFNVSLREFLFLFQYQTSITKVNMLNSSQFYLAQTHHFWMPLVDSWWLQILNMTTKYNHKAFIFVKSRLLDIFNHCIYVPYNAHWTGAAMLGECKYPYNIANCIFVYNHVFQFQICIFL